MVSAVLELEARGLQYSDDQSFSTSQDLASVVSCSVSNVDPDLQGLSTDVPELDER